MKEFIIIMKWKISDLVWNIYYTNCYETFSFEVSQWLHINHFLIFWVFFDGLAAFLEGFAAFLDGLAAFLEGLACFFDGLAVFLDFLAAFLDFLAFFLSASASTSSSSSSALLPLLAFLDFLAFFLSASASTSSSPAASVVRAFYSVSSTAWTATRPKRARMANFILFSFNLLL